MNDVLVIGGPRLGKTEAARVLEKQIRAVVPDSAETKQITEMLKLRNPSLVDLWKQFEAKK